MDIWIYILGSLYAVSALFRFSYSYSKYLIEHRFFGWVDRKSCAKIDEQRVDEWIYSTIHSLFIITLTGYSLHDQVIGGGEDGGGSGLIVKSENGSGGEPADAVKLTLALSLSYFTLDLIKCILRLNFPFILHHLCAINLLLSSVDLIYESPYAGSYLMAYLLLLEVNTPLMNLGFLLKAFNFDYNIYGTVWSVHLLSYILCRLVMIPYMTYYYFAHIGSESENLYYQIPNMLIIYLGSSYWAYRQMIGIQRKVVAGMDRGGVKL